MLANSLFAQWKFIEVVDTYKPAFDRLNDAQLIEGGHELTTLCYSMALFALRRVQEAKVLARKALNLTIRPPPESFMGKLTLVFELYGIIYEASLSQRRHHEAHAVATEAFLLAEQTREQKSVIRFGFGLAALEACYVSDMRAFWLRGARRYA